MKGKKGRKFHLKIFRDAFKYVKNTVFTFSCFFLTGEFSPTYVQTKRHNLCARLDDLVKKGYHDALYCLVSY